MDVKYAVADLRDALVNRLFPTITTWNRLEGRPRRADFDRALKAEVRDALWMLTKQWQIGEFKADDAGSPVLAKLRMRQAPLTKYKPANAATERFEPNVPLEAKAEQRRILWTWNDQKMRFDLRAQLGRQWAKMLAAAGLGAYEPQYRTRYRFELPATDEGSDYVHAHRPGWQQYAALAGRAIDGGDLYSHLIAPGGLASDGMTLTVPGDGGALDTLGTELVEWFAEMYYQPQADGAWKPPSLEYQFACSAPARGQEQVLTAEEYPGGHLDWYSFDRKGQPLGGAPVPGEAVSVNTLLPTPITFQGMPDPRWWSLEDRKTDFGSVRPSTTDVAQLLLIEFALVYADDWFLIPYRFPAGTLAHIDGLAVTNTFGERFWITPAGTGTEQNWHRWSMFQLSTGAPGRTVSPQGGLLIPPAAATVLEGDPFEEVELARDEVANMVWAVERTVPSLTGRGRSGKDEARETRAYHERLLAAGSPIPPAYQAAIAYLAMTEVPEHFIPFVPVHVPGSVREVQLQRSRMLRIMEGDPLPPDKVPPRTTLIRQGLDVAPKEPYFLHEEEVPRAGIRVTEAFQRTRWTNGEVYVWVGTRKQVGRGERSSGLAFDTIVPAKADNA